MPEEPTIKDVLVAINEFATSVDRRFDVVDKRFDRIESRVERIEDDMTTKEDLRKTKLELLTHIDGLTTEHKRLDLEVVSLRSQFERTKSATA